MIATGLLFHGCMPDGIRDAMASSQATDNESGQARMPGAKVIVTLKVAAAAISPANEDEWIHG
jgi:hypothetical protein